MAHVKLKGLKIYRDNRGKMRCYHRKTNTAIDLNKYPMGSRTFIAECQRLDAIADSVKKAQAGTLGLLIQEYKQSHYFDNLAANTRRDYERNFIYLEKLWKVNLTDFTRQYVIKVRDKAYQKNGRSRANYVLAVLSVLFGWGIDHGLMETNPAKGIKKIPRPKHMPDANRPWTDEERYTVLEEAPWKLKVPIALCMYTGLRENDALGLKKDQYDGVKITIKTAKAGKDVIWIAPGELVIILNDAPEHDAETLAANSRGEPWTDGGFRAEWRKFRIKLEEQGKIGKGLTIHGLRHTVGKSLRELGYNNKEVALALGHTEAMAAWYTKEADMTDLAREMTAAFDASESKKLSSRKEKLSSASDENLL